MSDPRTMYIANLAFLLDYDEGKTNDEIESDIFKVAFQMKESVHYDRSIGGGFQYLEQEPSNIVTGMTFATNLIEGIYYNNSDKGFDPYIIVGFSDITVENDIENNEYLVRVEYRLLQNMAVTGEVKI